MKSIKKKFKPLRLILIFLITAVCASSLSGCATSNPPQTELTEAQIYELAMQQSDAQTLSIIRSQVQRTPLPIAQETFMNFQGSNIEAKEKLNKMFPLLPNPETVVYVYPHLGADSVPIPGYYTTFHLYNKNYYALPGEVARSKT